jgi:hypothetical protein
MNDRLLTIAEVSKMLRGPIATLRRWRHIGEGCTGLASHHATQPSEVSNSSRRLALSVV